jgi:hypothetical protein
MDIQYDGYQVESEVRVTPADIDPEGLKILHEAGFGWDPDSLAFQRQRLDRRRRQSGGTIEYRFLREQKLVIGGGLDTRERTGQLQRLRILVQSMD